MSPATPFARPLGWPLESGRASSGCSTQVWSSGGSESGLISARQVAADSPSAVRPPISHTPFASATAIAPLRATGSLSASTSAQPVTLPSVRVAA